MPGLPLISGNVAQKEKTNWENVKNPFDCKLPCNLVTLCLSQLVSLWSYLATFSPSLWTHLICGQLKAIPIHFSVGTGKTFAANKSWKLTIFGQMQAMALKRQLVAINMLVKKALIDGINKHFGKKSTFGLCRVFLGSVSNHEHSCKCTIAFVGNPRSCILKLSLKRYLVLKILGVRVFHMWHFAKTENSQPST